LFVRDDNTQSGAAIHNVTVLPLIVPSLSHASLTNAQFKVGPTPTAIAAKASLGTSFKFTLAAPAKLTIAITHSASGVRRGKRCVAASRKRSSHGKRCSRSVKAGTLTRSNLQPGSNTIAFSGRIGRRALRPGRYKAILSAGNAKGKSKPVSIAFTVVR
ncbi:MAG TPA: hypothetical protein VFY36_05395, partial [Solirubrobacteraceae bacterium]|nr:hypothetical protein [Solirubrobacteraceae bacterium]